LSGRLADRLLGLICRQRPRLMRFAGERASTITQI
jgi:hypothetical protein